MEEVGRARGMVEGRNCRLAPEVFQLGFLGLGKGCSPIVPRASLDAMIGVSIGNG